MAIKWSGILHGITNASVGRHFRLTTFWDKGSYRVEINDVRCGGEYCSTKEAQDGAERILKKIISDYHKELCE
jgi:hypothetical protein